MARRQAEEVEFGDVPFLDTLCNIVGILIALIVIVGILSGQAPESALVDAAPAPAAETPSSQPKVRAPKLNLAGPTEELNTLTYDVIQAAAQLQEQTMIAAARDAERMRLAMDVAAGKRLIEERKQTLDAGAQADFALAQEVAMLNARIDQLDKDLAHVQDVPPEVVAIKHDTTPIAQLVMGDELHFRLHRGKISHVPLVSLSKMIKSEMLRVMSQVKPGEPYDGSVGPYDEYRASFTIDFVSRATGPNGEVGSGVMVSKAQFDPVSPDVGEDLATALSPTSKFRTVLSQVHPRRGAVTIWVYPESFVEYRKLKEELGRLGYACAARPLPLGQPIGASPDGSRSNAQ